MREEITKEMWSVEDLSADHQEHLERKVSEYLETTVYLRDKMKQRIAEWLDGVEQQVAEELLGQYEGDVEFLNRQREILANL